MLKRVLLVCLGLWLIAASGLAAHAGPCTMQDDVAAPVTAEAHCAMAELDAAPELPADPDKESHCCCPAVLAAIAPVAAPVPAAEAFTQSTRFPADIDAISRAPVPEPYPPKA